MRGAHIVRLAMALILSMSACFVHAARKLQQETYTTVRGHKPGGIYAVSQYAEAASASNAKGIRYNGGKVVLAAVGDVYPMSRAAAHVNWPSGASATAGNYPGDANNNLGVEAIAATYEGSRAVAGSGVSHTAELGSTVSYNIRTFKPQHIINPGSTAFTDNAPDSAAVSGQGNGPAVIAWANEYTAMSRAHRDPRPRVGYFARDGPQD